MVPLRKFESRQFIEAFLIGSLLWLMIGFLLLATVVHLVFVTLYGAFFATTLPLEEWVRTFIFFELVTAMLLSWKVMRHFVIPVLNSRILGVD